MKANEFVTLALLAVGGEIKGKTKLQKTVYFLGIMTDCLEELGYRPWFYGPYSDDVEAALTWAKTIGTVDQNVSARGFDQSGFEVRRYDFRLNEQGTRFAEAKARENPEAWQRIQDAARRLNEAGDLDYMDMSIAAKTYFLLGRKQAPTRLADLAEIAPQFGWNVSATQVQRAAEYLSKLHIVRILN
jgi:uncharacterized protein YwgA